MGGKRIDIEVKVALQHEDGSLRFTLSPHDENRIVIGAVTASRLSAMTFLRLPSEVIQKYGKRKGGYLELNVNHDGSAYSVGSQALAQIQTFDNLDGVLPRRKS